jgi:ABC-type sugar transport system substrate-binding protein
MDSEGENLVNQTNHNSEDFDPTWSPDGKQIAFVSNRPIENGEGQFIYIMNSDGSDLRQLTTETDSKFPDWSHDGKAITYTAYGDIFVIKADGSAPSVNLTSSLVEDTQSTWSNDGNQIAFLSGEDNNWNIFIISADGSNSRQLTDNGKAYDVTWTIDGRLFTHYEDPGGACFNCVMNADGSGVIDAGGKGSIQEFLPYWTLAGDRVELIAGDHINGNNEVMLVGDIYPDIFKNLTNNPANDTDPDWPANCGPVGETLVVTQETQEENIADTEEGIVIGYTGDRDDFEEAARVKACSELDVECREGADISDLVNQGVDVIVYFSNRWNVMGDSMKIHDAAVQRVPVIVVDAESSETNEPGVYNLSIDSTAMQTQLSWMFSEMGESGEFAYYNVGNSSFHQEVIASILSEYPNIQAISVPAEYDGIAMSDENIKDLLNKNPNLGAIWADEFVPNIFWAIKSNVSGKWPMTLCEAKDEIWQAWKQEIDSGSEFKCISVVSPGGLGYESVYVAYYLATGKQINPDSLGGIYGNTLNFDFPVVTNENLNTWIEKSVGFEMQNNSYKFPPMSPEEILSTWFQN